MVGDSAPGPKARQSTRVRHRAVDIGEDPLQATTDEEVSEWADRERRRRQAWAAGPTEEEKLAWAQHERQLRTFDPEYFGDPLGTGPTDDEVQEWAERETKRRKSWLAGPTEEDKRAWALEERRRDRSRKGVFQDFAVGPTDEEAKGWAEREQRRRQSWLEGPTDEEKSAWARRQRRYGAYPPPAYGMYDPYGMASLPDRLRRQFL